MDREWKIYVIGGYLTADVNNDADGLSAVIGGEIVGAPQAGGSDLPPQTMGNERYGPVTVRAQSLGELKWAVEERIEEDIGRVIKWSGV
jgi:hypothetical protein